MSVKKRKIRDSHISLESLNPEEEKKLLDNDLLKNAEANSDVDLKMNENEDEWKDKVPFIYYISTKLNFVT